MHGGLFSSEIIQTQWMNQKIQGSPFTYMYCSTCNILSYFIGIMIAFYSDSIHLIVNFNTSTIPLWLDKLKPRSYYQSYKVNEPFDQEVQKKCLNRCEASKESMKGSKCERDQSQGHTDALWEDMGGQGHRPKARNMWRIKEVLKLCKVWQDHWMSSVKQLIKGDRIHGTCCMKTDRKLTNYK